MCIDEVSQILIAHVANEIGSLSGCQRFYQKVSLEHALNFGRVIITYMKLWLF